MMDIEQTLFARSQGKCELCGCTQSLNVYEVPPYQAASAEQAILVCKNCHEQIQDPSKVDINHWRCLNDSMWTPIGAVQVMAWRMLNRLSDAGWPRDLLDMLYLEDELLDWAKADPLSDADTDAPAAHSDCHGAELQAGDSVTLTKDLNVKGANFTAKRGTTVRNISLVQDNPLHIEGKVDGQRIVILTKFVKKSC